MEPFVHLSEYPVILCKSCQVACVTHEIYSHLKSSHDEIKAKDRHRIIQTIQAIPGLIQDQAGLQAFQYPPPTTEPIPFLAPPEVDGLGCNQCSYISRQRQRIQQHCQKEHQWENDWKKGGNVASRAKQERIVPWRIGVRCQRFFRSRVASGWFEVGRESGPSGGQAGNSGVTEDLAEKITRIHQAQANRFEARKKGTIRVANDKTEPNGWVKRVGWDDHLSGLDPDRLRNAAGPIQGDEAILQGMCDSLDRVLDQARATTVPMKVGLPALFEVERKEVDVKPNRPFDSRLEDDTWARYKDVWRKMMCIWQRTQTWEDEDRPPFRLTVQQGERYDAFEEAVEVVVEGSPAEVKTGAEIDRLCLDMLIGFLDHQLKRSHYDNIVLSALAVLGIREDQGWVDAIDYTPIYSAVIKCARMFVVHQSYLESEEEISGLMGRLSISEEEAYDQSSGLFTIVRAKVQRFMTRTGKKLGAQPTPMDWIYDSRTYGRHIRFNTPTSGSIDWDGDRIKYRRIEFGIGQLSEMLHTLVEEARGLLGQLTMVEVEGLEGLPRIEWSKLEDDHSEDRVGYSFLQDDRNEWLGKGKDWVLRRILESKVRQQEWVSNSSGGDDANPYRARTVRAYSRTLAQFRERLWMLMYMATLPGRTTEVSGIRVVNTVNGGIRNVLAHKRMMSYVTSYHKGYRATGYAKVIHRYLPREMGELLLWYMWLVLPFWQQVQGIVKQADHCSPFLWADEIVSQTEEEGGVERREREREQREREGQREGEQVGEAGEEDAAPPITEGFTEWLQEPKWTADRVRRILQRHSRRLLDHQLNISSWRHIAIAIANRYLKAQFGQDGAEGDEDEDGIDDHIADLQAGHGTYIAGMIYARELQQFQGSTATRQDQFRAISQRWHRLLGFGAEDWGTSVTGSKRRREAYDSEREDARYRRFARLQQVDIDGQLRQMMGEDARFRGNQKAVIQAIIRGESPIIQIAGTGEGKSLSFMLPAYCSPEGGVTIVVVPLVALREDLQSRCEKSRIESHVWQSSRQGNPMASIIYVTPESAVTKGFRDFVNRLQMRQQLDRVVVDECHVVLDGEKDFRPQLLELGPVLREWGVQLVFLTATLPPLEEEDFFRRLGLSAGRAHIIRSRTTRKNIAYHVEAVEVQKGEQQEEEEDARVCAIVQAYLDQQVDGRVIVYAGTIERVDRLAEKLGCDRYHSKVDTVEGKTRRLRAWIKGGRLVVATNALGLGVDVPDVRLVVHAGMPGKLRDYVQESGRAGRDGGSSKAVVVWRKARKVEEKQQDTQRKGKKGGGPEWEDAVEEFIEGKGCRRVVLDRVMDKWIGRVECEEDEEACDICRRRIWERELMERAAEVEEEVAAARRVIRDNFDVQRREARFERWRMQREAMQEGEEVADFEMEIERWAESCVLCQLTGVEEADHDFEECPNRAEQLWKDIQVGIREMERGMFTRKRLADFSACFGCGLPQRICQAWQAMDDDGGRFQRQPGQICQYTGLLAKLFSGVYMVHPERAQIVIARLSSQAGFAWNETDELYPWLGERVTWAGLETNRLCQVVYHFCKAVQTR